MFCVIERMQLAALLQRREREMPGVGFRGPGRMFEARLPGRLAHFRIGHVVVDVRKLLRQRILRPHALWPAEIRNARFGGDAGAGEHDDPLRVIDPGFHLIQRRHAERVDQVPQNVR